jgi:hypothetical protein
VASLVTNEAGAVASGKPCLVRQRGRWLPMELTTARHSTARARASSRHHTLNDRNNRQAIPASPTHEDTECLSNSTMHGQAAA